MKLKARPIGVGEANTFVKRHHRHHAPVLIARYAVGVEIDGALVGVAIVGNPLARALLDGYTAEVVRVCVTDDAPLGACSFLYARCWRIWQQMGGRKLVTYTLQSEGGASLRGAGWAQEALLDGRSGWDTPSRPRVNQPISTEPKIRWSKESE